ncbi:ribosome biogenesis GTP-binding protein YihA/YsxC [bacterium]|nr:ribosome biogenesis GTP-binding protein YihA/YsxC [bacterium]
MSSDIKIKDVALHSSATTLQALPAEGIPEIAIIGRSNVGKSTLLNRLTGRKKLAYTSSVPGKTQSFQSYEVHTTYNGEEHLLHLVDLPGFGYAKFAKKKREYISRLTVDYIMHRHCLRGIFLLTDIRREPKEDELSIQSLTYENGVPLVIVLTKADKIKKGELKKRQKEVAAAYALEAEDLLITGEKLSTTSLWQQIHLLTALPE